MPLCRDLVVVALNGLCNEVPDPLLNAVNDLGGIVLFVGASAVSLVLGIFKESTDIVLEVMVVDLADFQLDGLVCSFDVSFLLFETGSYSSSSGSNLS